MTPTQLPDIKVQAQVPINSRFVVSEMTYHQSGIEQPTCTESRYSRRLKSEEQPYSRKIKVSEEPKQLDTGWLGDDVGMILLQNVSTTGTQIIPSLEETASIKARVIEVGICHDGPDRLTFDPLFLILSGESLRVCPVNAKRFYLRCRNGTADCRTTLLPQ